jgi:hypothetical protein
MLFGSQNLVQKCVDKTAAILSLRCADDSALARKRLKWLRLPEELDRQVRESPCFPFERWVRTVNEIGQYLIERITLCVGGVEIESSFACGHSAMGLPEGAACQLCDGLPAGGCNFSRLEDRIGRPLPFTFETRKTPTPRPRRQSIPQKRAKSPPAPIAISRLAAII